MPVVEIAWWTASDAFVADRSIIKPVLDFLKKVDGCNAVYSGFAQEERTYFLFVVWETLQHHKDLIAHPEYPQILGLGPTIGEGSIKLFHVEFNKDLIPAVSAPVTEVLAINLKEGKTKDDLYNILNQLTSKIDALNMGHKPVVWGPTLKDAAWSPTLEDPTKFYLTIGWKSTAFHAEVVRLPHIVPHLRELQSTVKYRLLHVDFAKHT